MKVPTLLQALPTEPRSLPPLPQGGRGFAALLSLQHEGLAGAPPGGMEPPAPAPGISGDLAEFLSGLQDAMAGDLETLPELSPAGLERVERAMAGRIADSLAAFDAEHGTGMMDSLGAETPDVLAAHLFRTMTADPASARTPDQSLDTAITQVAMAIGIEAPAASRTPASRNAPSDHGPLLAPPAPHRRADAPPLDAGPARRRTELPPAGMPRTAEGVPHPQNAALVKAQSPTPGNVLPQATGQAQALQAQAPHREAPQRVPEAVSETAGREPRLAQDTFRTPAGAETQRAAPAAPDQPRAAPTPAAPSAPPAPATPPRPAEPAATPVPLAPLTPAAPSAPATAPVPAAPVAPPAPAEPPVLDQIRRAGVTAGRTRIELSPEGLGTLEIDLSADEAGQLRVVVRAENPAVLSMLRGDRAGLLGALGDGGVSLGEAGLDFESFAGDRRDRSERDEPRLPHGRPAEEPVETRPADPASYRPRPLEGRLDILT